MPDRADDYTSLLEYWFGADPDNPSAATVARWRALGALHVAEWRPDPNADAAVIACFGGTLDSMAAGRLEDWLKQPRGRLAYVLAADSLPRAAYRQTRHAYDFADRAVAAVMLGIAGGVESSLNPIERSFFYLPLTHAEKPGLQQRSLECYRALMLDALRCGTAPGPLSILDVFLRSAERHASIVRRFGHFPHRNAVLQRQSTAEERKYLDDPWQYSL